MHVIAAFVIAVAMGVGVIAVAAREYSLLKHTIKEEHSKAL